tara:strand:+ start:1669 stop:2202 length:534 start_codon:yes stop_codon:yes gene_type:complete
MIYLECKNDLLIRELASIFYQCDMPLTTNPDIDVFMKLSLEIFDRSISVKTDNDKFSLAIPIEVVEFNKQIIQKCQNLVFQYKLMKYYPFKQLIIFKDKQVVLRNTHNIIFKSLLLNMNNKGINKKELYEKVWPNDKNLQMNKLDTHLTNLKNYLYSDLDLSISILSKSNHTKLIID